MMGLFVAMARVALVLDKGRRILDEPRPGMTLRTLEISELDVEAIHACMTELVRLRDDERAILRDRKGKADQWAEEVKRAGE